MKLSILVDVRAKQRRYETDFDLAFRHHMIYKGRHETISMRLRNWVTQHAGTERETRARAQVADYASELRATRRGS